jgi:GntR family transcriptional regulator of arabinose operon
MTTKSRYLDIKDYVSELIAKEKEGALLPAESQLCRIFDVSRVPVRRAMDELAKEGLIYRKRGRGTFIRKNFHPGDRLNFTVMLPQGASKGDPFCFTVCTGILTKSVELNARSYIFSFTGRIQDILKETRVSPEDGILWIGPIGDEYRVLEELRERNYPVMILNRIMKNSHFNYISTDHINGAKDITDYFLNKGHKKIGFVGLREGNLALTQRYEGFLQAFQLKGREYSRDGVVWSENKGYHPLKLADFKNSLEEMFTRYSPTALFINGGQFLGAVLQWMKKKNLRIPGDLELVLFDEVPASCGEKEYIHEVIQPFEEIGSLSAEKMAQILAGKKSVVRITLPPSLCIKET